MGKSTINGPFSMSMLNNQRVSSFTRVNSLAPFHLGMLWTHREFLVKRVKRGNPLLGRSVHKPQQARKEINPDVIF